MQLKIRSARRMAGLTQADLASATGIDRTSISRMERGFAHVKVDQLVAIANALNVSITDLLDFGKEDIASVWAIALELALYKGRKKRFSSDRAALEKALADLEAAHAETTELADRLAAEMEDMQSRIVYINAAELAARNIQKKEGVQP